MQVKFLLKLIIPLGVTLISQSIMADWVQKSVDIPLSSSLTFDMKSHISTNTNTQGQLVLSIINASNYELSEATFIDNHWVISAPKVILDETGSYGSHNVDSNGNTHMLHYNISDWGLYYSSNQSGAWQSAMILSAERRDQLGMDVRIESIVIDQQGYGHVLLTSPSKKASIYYLTNRSGHWEGEMVYKNEAMGNNIFIGGELTNPTMVIDSEGSAFIAFANKSIIYGIAYGIPLGKVKIYYATNQSGKWKKKLVKRDVKAFAGETTAPIISLHNNGDLQILYTSLPNDISNSDEVLKYGVSGKFGFLKVSEIEKDNDLRALASAVDQQGQAHIVYRKNDTLWHSIKADKDQEWVSDVILTTAQPVAKTNFAPGDGSAESNKIFALDGNDIPHYFYLTYSGNDYSKPVLQHAYNPN